MPKRTIPKRTTIAAALVRAAVLNGVNPQAWLADALERMVRGQVTSTGLAELLPWRWLGRDALRPAAA
jgi:hypothetical protein